MRLPFGRIRQELSTYQVWQRQIVEKVLHELFPRDAENEVIVAGAVCR